MKILWFSNKILNTSDPGRTATWVDAMARPLVETGAVELVNVATDNIRVPQLQSLGAIRQWIVPQLGALNADGLPNEKKVKEIVQLVKQESPDLIHVWGTEYPFGLITARGLLPQPALLEIQGLKFAIADVYAGGLTWVEQLACVGFKEFVRGTAPWQMRRSFEKWGIFEKEIIAGHRHIVAQSEWQSAVVAGINPDAEIFRRGCAMRDAFSASPHWQYSAAPRIFVSSAYPAPYKGLHVAIRALAMLKSDMPDIQLRIAGALQRPGLRQEGYIAWLNRLIRSLGLISNVKWLGPLGADEIAIELRQCSVALIPSYIESYSLALAEAMSLGVPVVATRCGAMPDMASHEESALFFPLEDVETCAHHIERLINNRPLAETVSQRARQTSDTRENTHEIVAQQLEIYREMLAEPMLRSSISQTAISS